MTRIARFVTGALLLWALTTSASATTDPYLELSLIRPRTTQASKDFAVNSPQGTPISLADYRGKVVFLNFWATWCAPCLEEMPAMERLYRRYRERGLVVIAVSLDKNLGVVEPFVKQHRFTFPIGQDPAWKVAERYNVRVLPTTVLLDRQGNLAALALGPREWDTTPSYAVVESLLR